MKKKNSELNSISAERFKLLLAENDNMQQKEIAILMKVSEVTVSQWANGKKNISEGNAEKLVSILAKNPDYMTVNWLLGKSNYRSEQEYLSALNWAERVKNAYPAFKINQITEKVIPIIFDYQKMIVPLDAHDKPIIDDNPLLNFQEFGLPARVTYKSIDFSDESVKRYALASVSLEDGSVQGGYDAVFERNEIATIMFEIIQSITHKIQFETLCHNKRFSDGIIFDDIADELVNLGEDHAEEE